MPDAAHDNAMIDRFRRARRDHAQALLEGFHPLKHAARFGADLLEVVTDDRDALLEACDRLAPDLVAVARDATVVEPSLFSRLSPGAVRTAVSRAARPAASIDALPAAPGPAATHLPGAGRVVLLERPSHLGNLGAVVRVAAAAGAAAVLATGRHDPWHPAALRGSAGLHYALPVLHVDAGQALATGRPLVAVDPDGDEPDEPIPPGAILAFGSERAGLSDDLIDAADRRIRIPMRDGVSSLNLATAVAVILYAGGAAPPPENAGA